MTDGRRALARTRGLLAAYLALVLLPLGALAWLAARLARAEVERANLRIGELAEAGLAATVEEVDRLLATRRQAVLDAVAAAPRDETALRDVARRLPGVRQTFWVDHRGQLAYPSPGGELDREEAAFLRRTAGLWSGGRLAGSGEPVSQTTATPLDRPGGRSREGTDGCYPWHLEDGLHVLCFRREDGRGMIGAELDRIPALADLVAELAEPGPALAGGRVQLLDAEGRVLHQWGPLDPGERRPIARVTLAEPLAAWSLVAYDPGTRQPGLAAAASGAVPWLAALGVVVLLLAVHVYRTSRRELAEAATRVSFVNQVSHELKTPLTNVRMYAELLAAEVEDEPEATRYAEVIVAEAERLSRLIANVLAFAREERGELRLHPREGVPDEVIAKVLATFAPALAARGVTIEPALAAGTTFRFDPDALEQILGNLLTNVEKYAPNSGVVRVTSALGEDGLRLRVADAGPGIAAALAERIFQPFYRVSNALTDGVSGAGLGLTIARQLARRHGGELALVRDPGRGATFELWLADPPAPSVNLEESR